MSELKRGDTITFAGVYRLAWWKRALIWLRLMRKPEPAPLKQFVVTRITLTRMQE